MEVLNRPRASETWGELGMVLQVHQFYPEAVVCYQEASRLDSTETRWHYARGLIALKSGDLATAIPLFRSACSSSSHHELIANAKLQLGEALLEMQNWTDARKWFEEVRASDANNPRAAFGLALIAIERKDRSAAEYLTIARSSPYYRKRATAQLAAVARSRNDPKVAEFEREVASLPDDPAWPDPFIDQLIAHRACNASSGSEAESLEHAQQFAAAANAYLRQIETDPSPRAFIGAGLNLARTGQFERAMPLLREAIRRDPDNYKAHHALVKVLMAHVEKESKASPLAPATASIYLQAIEHARRTIELKPDHTQAYLLWGIALKELGEAKQALIPLRRGIAASPMDVDLRVTLAEVLVDLGEIEEAQKTIDDARSIEPKDPRLARILARANAVKP